MPYPQRPDTESLAQPALLEGGAGFIVLQLMPLPFSHVAGTIGLVLVVAGALVIGIDHLPEWNDKAKPSPPSPKPSGFKTSLRQASPAPSVTKMADILGGLDAVLRHEELKTLADQLGRSDPQHGWALLKTIPGLADRETFASALLQAWAGHDLAGALSACKTLPSGELRATSHATVMAVWARHAPVVAADWARTQLAGSARQTALAAVARTWAQKDAGAAARWAQTYANTSTGQAVIAEVMTHWANTDPQSGTAWAASLPAGAFRDSALQAVVGEWADQYPAEAAAWVQSNPENGALGDQVAQTWASHDPAPASDWALSLKDPEQRQSTALIAFSTWAAAAPQEALIKVQTIRDAPLRQEITAAVLDVWQTDDPAAAQAWQAAHPQN